MEKPLLVYDGRCGFCRFWIESWRAATGDRIEYAPSQEVADRFPQIAPERFAESVQLILPGGAVYGGAEAVFRSLAYAPGKAWMLWLYQYLAGFAPVSEWCYRLVARHRDFFSVVTRIFWGRQPGPPSYHLTRWLFLRLLGLVYFFAFLSLWTQVTGLIGSRGVLPASSLLAAVAQQIGAGRYHALPTLLWFNSSDAFLMFLCVAGTLVAIPVILGVAEGPLLTVLWVFYLSLVTVGQDFLEFQWDVLLLEAGFLAIFFAPWRLLAPHGRRSSGANPPPSGTILWLLRWLLFRLVFLSGSVKLLSHDLTWRNLTALDYHYWTQPLPTPVAWYAAQLPAWFQKASTFGVFVIEIGVPFLIFLPRRVRLLGAAVLCAFQCLIALTGNYAFFNLLAVTLCVTLLDDAVLAHWLPSRLTARLRDSSVVISHGRDARATPVRAAGSWRLAARDLGLTVLTIVILSISGANMARTFGAGDDLPRVIAALDVWIEPFHITSGYGLFAVMTTSRPEIIIQGSLDGRTWRDYAFKYKPGDVRRRPRWVEPFQPRLDWQMWFAALGSYRNNRWFVNLMVRLLQGSPEVLRLFENDPFRGTPPRYIRAVLYEYHFTDFAAHRATGDWWRREPKALYFPIATLNRQ